tara:strand:- start:7130 stop:8131 length:1002 start_codon:yes stop_codon:yes gene_type:complete
MLNNKTIIITGGTGSFGKKFISTILKKYKKIKKIIIFSRDELKQFEMMKDYEKTKHHKILRFFIGDIRDSERLNVAFKDVDIVIHAAALKQVPTSEYNPFETIKTNIIGTQNVVECCLKNNVSKLISLSTDKASSPINLYGATKLCSDKLVVSAENIKGKSKLVACVVRYGNVMGSRGSIVPLLIEKKNDKTIELTHKEMTRFNISLDYAVEMVLLSMKQASGGEIFVPKIASYNLIDLAKAIMPKSKIKFVGIRPGEKLHEEMISFSESINSVIFDKYYVILPTSRDYKIKDYIKKNGGKEVTKTFEYRSDTNKDFLSVKKIQNILRDYISY